MNSPSHIKQAYKKRAFTLIELSIVVLVLSILTAAALRYSAAIKDSNNVITLNTTLDAIDAALINYRVTYGRLPCPADMNSYAENTANFGLEAGTTSGIGTGECVSGPPVPAADFENTTTDPDGTGGSDPGAPDGNYDSTTLNQVEAGGVPTKTLRLPDKYAYDPWGRRILYAVDKRMTIFNAFTANPITTSGATTIGAIVIKKTYNDTLAKALTFKAVYALVSLGKIGHGGYVRNLTAAQTPYNAASSDNDLRKNCHCTATGAAGTFDRIFVLKPKTTSFDSVVRYRLRNEIDSGQELQ